MSITITPGLDNQEPKKPKKNIFGTANQRAFKEDNDRKGIYVDPTGNKGLAADVARVSKDWYKGDPALRRLLESYHRQITGDKIYKAMSGARYGFLGQLARRLPAPVLFDDPEIASFMFGGNKPTACVDTSGRQWVWAEFFEECMQEEARGLTMVVPLNLHEYSHIALNHVHRMHNFPPDVSNIAKDKVINPMVKKMFSADTSFSKIFSEAHGNCEADKKYENLSEETIAKMIMQERRKALEEKGTIHIKNLIIVDGPVRKVTTLTAGRDELKEYDTITVCVEDQGMTDAVDHIFDCATLEIDNIDNRLKTRHRNGAPGPKSEGDSPIEIPTASNTPSQGDGSGKGKAGDQNQQADSDPNKGNDEGDAGRKSLEDVKRDAAAAKQQAGKAGGQGAQGQDADNSPGQAGQGQGPTSGGQPSQGGDNAAGQQPGGAGQVPQQGQHGPLDPTGQGKGQGRPDPAAGSQVGDGSGLKGSPDDVLGSLIRTNPMDAPQGHEIDINKLNDWLKATGRSELVDTMRLDEFAPEQVERAIDVALNEAEKERLIIGSGYAGGHVNDYVTSVVRPNSSYKVHWERRITDFLQGQGTNVAKTMDEYGIYTYIDPTDIGMPADEGIYYEGTVQEKPEGRFLVLIDTSGSVWADKKRLGHFLAFALGIKATADEMSPDVDIVGADTVVTGKPQMYDEDSILEAIESGVSLGGGGGTDFTTPLNQILAWAKENDIKYEGIVYVTDFECGAPTREDLPEDMPPLVWAGMPHDYVKAEHFIQAVSTYSEVVVMENDRTYDLVAAQDKAKDTAHLGHDKLAA